MAETIRLTMPTENAERLKELAESRNVSEADIMGLAMGLYELVDKNVSLGAELCFIWPDKTVQRINFR